VLTSAVNSYQYVLNDPVNHTDPLGLLPQQQEQFLYLAAVRGNQPLLQAVLMLLEECTTSGLPRALFTSAANGQFPIPEFKASDRPLTGHPDVGGDTFEGGGAGGRDLVVVYPRTAPNWNLLATITTIGSNHVWIDKYYKDQLVNPRLNYHPTPTGPVLSDDLVGVVAHELFHSWLDYPAGIHPRNQAPYPEHLAAYYFQTEVLDQLWHNPSCLCP